MRSLRLFLPLALLALGGCALRPRYVDLVKPDLAGNQVRLVLLQQPERAPLVGVKVELSEGKQRYTAVTGPDGTFSLPVTKAYRDENPVVVVAVPAGVAGYAIEAAPQPPPPAAAPAEGAPQGDPAAQPTKL